MIGRPFIKKPDHALDWHQRFLQQARWTAQMRTHILQQTGFTAAHNMRLLEVGCGTGAILQNLEYSCAGELHGLDLSFSRLRQAQSHTSQAFLTCADAHHLPYASRCLDGVACHFLLLWLTEAQEALLEMRRVVKSGGWVIAFAEPDYLGRIDHPASLQNLGALQNAALTRQGANIAAGRSLRGLFHQAGLINVQAGLISGHWQTGLDQTGWQQEWQIIQADLLDQIPTAELETLRQKDHDAWLTGERILYIPTFYAWGQVP
jgi:SAM-dependent methyltransferase